MDKNLILFLNYLFVFIIQYLYICIKIYICIYAYRIRSLYRIRELDMKEMKKTIESLIIIGLMKLKNRQIK